MTLAIRAIAALLLANTIVSQSPRVQVRLPQNARFLGNDRFVLFGIADCDLYAFVQADAEKHVRKLYWVQFEGYLPSLPALHHQYASARHATLGGLDFYVDTWAESSADRARPPDLAALAAAIRAKGYKVPAGLHSGSDEQHIDALIRSKGYVLPPETMSVRFVHLLDEKRKELMIIYTEAAPAGLTGAQLRGAENGLVARAEQQISIHAY